MLRYDTLEIGDEVRWTGNVDMEIMDTDIIFKIVGIGKNKGENTIVIISDGYSEFEVYLSELY